MVKKMMVRAGIALGLTLFSFSAFSEGRCADDLSNLASPSGAPPIHHLDILTNEKNPTSFQIVDHFGGQTKNVITIHFGSLNPLTISSVELGYIYREIPNSEVPSTEKLLNVTWAKEIDDKLNAHPEIIAPYGIQNGINVTSGHRSILIHTTSDGTYHRQAHGLMHVLVLDKTTLRPKRVFKYDLNAGANRIRKMFDLDRIIDEYVSSFEDPTPTAQALKEHNQKLAEMLASNQE